MSERVVDLFGGAGGWDVPAVALGMDVVGIELDDTACATRRAAGLVTVQGDVAALEPKDFAPVHGLIASAPCQPFSMAGLGVGRHALEVYAEEMRKLLDLGEMALDRDRLREYCEDPRADLVIEPLRWALALRPVWVALEQVEPVLPLWGVMAVGLREMGYSVWTGICSAERWGVPQTRRRAILLARCDGVEARQPPPTHARYIAPRRRDVQEETLFDVPEPERIVVPEDRHLLPWVSMSEALGWGMTSRPSTTVVTGANGGGPDPMSGGSGSRAAHARERAAGRWRLRMNDRENATERSINEPAPTITAANDYGERVWLAAGTNEHDVLRSQDEPAPTISTQSRNDSWVYERPATTVTCDPRIHPGGHKVNQDDLDAGREYEGRAGVNAVRVSVVEAGVLQSFPADFPWQGSKTAIFAQIGNAVPVLLALAILEEVTRDA